MLKTSTAGPRLQHSAALCSGKTKVGAAGGREVGTGGELVRICGLTHVKEQPAGMGGAQSLCQEEPQAYAIPGMSHQLGKNPLLACFLASQGRSGVKPKEST